MSSKKHIYVTNTFYYLLIPALRNILVFLTLPILTRFLSPEDYGTVGIITMLVGFGTLFFAGLNSSCFRLFFKYKDDPETLTHMLSTNMIFIIGSSLIYGIGLMIIFPWVNRFFFSGHLPVLWVALAFFQFLLMNINAINQSLLQGMHDGKSWTKNEVVALAVQVPLVIFLVITKRFTFEAIIISTLVAEIVKFLFILFKMGRRYYRPVFKKHLLKESLLYSWPSVPTTLIGFGHSYLDRVLLSTYYGLLQVGLLEMSTKVASILKMSMDGVDGVLSPLNMEYLTENTNDSLTAMARTNLRVVFFLLFVSLCLILSVKEFVILLMTKEYYPVMYIAPLCIYSHVFGILSMPTFWLIYYRADKTYIKIVMNALFLIISVSINIVMIPRYGVMGAAAAIFISAAITQTAQFFIGLRITPIPLDKSKILILFIVLLVQTGLVYGLYLLDLGIVADILTKVVLALSFVELGRRMSIFTIEEFRTLAAGAKDSLFKKIFAYT